VFLQNCSHKIVLLKKVYGLIAIGYKNSYFWLADMKSVATFLFVAQTRSLATSKNLARVSF